MFIKTQIIYKTQEINEQNILIDEKLNTENF